MRYYLLVFFWLLISTLFAQERMVYISGFMAMEGDSIGLPNGKVQVTSLHEEKSPTFSVANNDGEFILGHPFADTLYVTVSFIQCDPQQIVVFPAQEDTVRLDTIRLKRSDDYLNTVHVIGEAVPIIHKEDTTTYNVDSFETTEGARVKELLEALPGVTVHPDGNIFVNGIKVDKILVDGKPFFDSDLTIVSESLAKDMLEKVQVTTTRTESEVFLGEDGDGETRTINLVLKKENKEGYFGEGTGGAGSAERYIFNTTFNRFQNERRTSVFANGNNMNISRFAGNTGATISDKTIAGQAVGINTDANLGIDFSDDLGENITFSGDYLFTRQQTLTAALFSRENTTPNFSFFTNGMNETEQAVDRHDLQFTLNLQPSKTVLITIQPSFNYQKNGRSTESTETRKDSLMNLVSDLNRNQNKMETKASFDQTITLAKRLPRKGHSLKFVLTNRSSKNGTSNLNYALTKFTTPSLSDTMQKQRRDLERKNHSADLSTYYNLPLGSSKWKLQLFTEYAFDHSQMDERTVMDYDSTENIYAQDPFLQSTLTRIRHHVFSGGKLLFNGEKWKGNLKTGYNLRSRRNADPFQISNNFTQRLHTPTVSTQADYKINTKSQFNLGYYWTQTPALAHQLQSLPDVSDPWNTIIGNPTLRPENNHHFRLSFRSFDYQKNRSFFSFFSFNIRTDQIVAQRTIDPFLVQQTTYVNADGGFHFSGNINYSKHFRIDSNYTVKLHAQVISTINKIPLVQNMEFFSTTLWTANPSLSVQLIRRKMLRIMARYAFMGVQSMQEGTSIPFRKQTQHHIEAKGELILWNRLTFFGHTQLQYSPVFDSPDLRTTVVLNIGTDLSFADGRGQVGIFCYDLLGQNQVIRQSVTPTYVDRREMLTLTRYAMLRFSWAFGSVYCFHWIKNTRAT